MVGLEYACADDRGGAEIVTFDSKTGNQLQIQNQVIPVGLQGLKRLKDKWPKECFGGQFGDIQPTQLSRDLNIH